MERRNEEYMKPERQVIEEFAAAQKHVVRRMKSMAIIFSAIVLIFIVAPMFFNHSFYVARLSLPVFLGMAVFVILLVLSLRCPNCGTRFPYDYTKNSGIVYKGWTCRKCKVTLKHAKDHPSALRLHEAEISNLIHIMNIAENPHLLKSLKYTLYVTRFQ